MADEFIKGLAGLIVGGLGWIIIAGWYNTPSFEEEQLIAPDPEPAALTFLDQAALVLRDAFLVFAIASAVTFWLLLPMYNEYREYRAENS